MSKTVDIPGGTAELLERHELTRRKQLPLKSLLHRSADLLNKIVTARKVTGPDGQVEEDSRLPGEDLVLSEHEADILARINCATTWAFLKSWTIDHPFPDSLEAFLDVPADVVDALDAAVQKFGSVEVEAAFEPSEETLDDPKSPTGRSAGTATTSGARTKRKTSTRN